MHMTYKLEEYYTNLIVLYNKYNSVKYDSRHLAEIETYCYYYLVGTDVCMVTA